MFFAALYWARVLDGACVRLNSRPNKETEKVEKVSHRGPEWALLPEVKNKDRGKGRGWKDWECIPWLGEIRWDQHGRNVAQHRSWAPPRWKGEMNWEKEWVGWKWSEWCVVSEVSFRLWWRHLAGRNRSNHKGEAPSFVSVIMQKSRLSLLSFHAHESQMGLLTKNSNSNFRRDHQKLPYDRRAYQSGI